MKEGGGGRCLWSQFIVLFYCSASMTWPWGMWYPWPPSLGKQLKKPPTIGSEAISRRFLPSFVLRLFLWTFFPYRNNPSIHHPLNFILIEIDRAKWPFEKVGVRKINPANKAPLESMWKSAGWLLIPVYRVTKPAATWQMVRFWTNPRWSQSNR